MNNELNKMVDEVVKIYFDFNCTVREAIEKTKEMILNEDSKVDMVKKVN